MCVLACMRAALSACVCTCSRDLCAEFLCVHGSYSWAYTWLKLRAMLHASAGNRARVTYNVLSHKHRPPSDRPHCVCASTHMHSALRACMPEHTHTHRHTHTHHTPSHYCMRVVFQSQKLTVSNVRNCDSCPWHLCEHGQRSSTFMRKKTNAAAADLCVSFSLGLCIRECLCE